MNIQVTKVVTQKREGGVTRLRSVTEITAEFVGPYNLSERRVGVARWILRIVARVLGDIEPDNG
jgi:hypothetical protein